MELTFDFLKAQSACTEGMEWYLKQDTTDDNALLDIAIASNDIETLKYANWGICRLFTHTKKIQYAIYAAELVLDIFEKKYPNDKRPRKAIETASEYLTNVTEEKKLKCRVASAAAAAASAAASAAAAAASASAYAAAAAYASASAYASAYAAAAAYASASAYASAYASASAYAAASAYASADAVKIQILIKILVYGKELLNSNKE